MKNREGHKEHKEIYKVFGLQINRLRGSVPISLHHTLRDLRGSTASFT